MADGAQTIEQARGAAASSEAVSAPAEELEGSAEQLLADFLALHPVRLL